MNTGQMLLSIGAIFLLSFLILRVNTTQLRTEEDMGNTKFGIMAISVATSVIEAASNKAYDENSYNNFVSSLTQLTDPTKLGPDKAEVYPNFNDFDDYNGLDQDISIPGDINSLHVNCTVVYVTPIQPDIKSSIKTFNKKIEVAVSSKYMQDTIKLSSIFSYWKKL